MIMLIISYMSHIMDMMFQHYSYIKNSNFKILYTKIVITETIYLGYLISHKSNTHTHRGNFIIDCNLPKLVDMYEILLVVL